MDLLGNKEAWKAEEIGAEIKIKMGGIRTAYVYVRRRRKRKSER